MNFGTLLLFAPLALLAAALLGMWLDKGIARKRRRFGQAMRKYEARFGVTPEERRFIPRR